MRLHRFYVAQPLGEVVVINDVSLIKQWTKVFRYSESDFVILFNGDGDDTTYSISEVNKQECRLTYVKRTPSYIPTKNITLYVSLIKKDNFELVAQKVTELGVTKIVPIISERSEKKNINEERLSKIVIEASEQCGRGDIPEISPVVKLSDTLLQLAQGESSFVLQMGGLSWQNATEVQKNNLNLFIGPEGGWSEGEELLFNEKGITSLSLGKTVLRAETAAITVSALASLLQIRKK